MKQKIVVAGATGNLGERIVRALKARDAHVVALVRPQTTAEKKQRLVEDGAEIVQVEMSDVDELAKACLKASCVVSAVAGLRDVIIDAQSVLANAAVEAGVKRLIPSDYSMDFTKLPQGTNRNLDLRREFYQRLEQMPIAATSILNGAFADMLKGQMPLVDFEGRRVSYWEDADVKMDFTTMNDTAAFTAAVALSHSTPRVLRVAGEQVSARDLANIAGEVTGSEFELVKLGSLEDLAGLIEKERAGDAEGERSLYPKWQGMQYVHGMFSGLGKLEPLDNERYPDIRWTSVKEVLAARQG